MASAEGEGNGKVHLEDSGLQDPLLTYKRRRLAEPQPVDAPEQVSDVFWKSRDIGWEHGIMIDENRQHWRCKYCGLTRYGGGVSRLKRHLAGDLDVKRCPKVPKDVSEKMRDYLKKKRCRRYKARSGFKKTTRSPDDTMVEKHQLPVELEKPAGSAIHMFEETANQRNIYHQEHTLPEETNEGPICLPRPRDIGWEHAVNVDGNKRRWECKWCGLSRSGGVTTLKAHLTDNSCPNIPKDASKKILDFIEEKKAARNYFTSNRGSPPGDLKLDKDQVHDLQMQVGNAAKDFEKDIVQSKSVDPSSNAMDKQTPERGAVIEGEAGSSQWSAESSKEPVEHGKQSKERGRQPEEHKAMEHDIMSLKIGVNEMADCEHQEANGNLEKSRVLQALKGLSKTMFDTRKHAVMINEKTRHWECRYCAFEGSGTPRLKYHLAGFRPGRCPNVPKNISEKVRKHVMIKRRLKTQRAEAHIHSNSEKTLSSDDDEFGKYLGFADLETPAGSTGSFGETSGKLKIENKLSSSPTQLSIKTAFNEGEAGSNQWSAESSKEPVEHGEQSKERGRQPEEHKAMEHDIMSLKIGVNEMADCEHQAANGNLEKSRVLQALKGSSKTRFDTRKHAVMINEKTRHWECRYCAFEGSGTPRLKYHLAGFRPGRCPNVPKNISEKVRKHVMIKRRLKMQRAEAHIHSNSEKTLSSDDDEFGKYLGFADLETRAGNTGAFGETSGKLKIENKLSSSPTQLSIKTAFNEVSRSYHYPGRQRDSAWEHSLVHDRGKGHWQCKWCGHEGYHGVTRLKWHLVGWNSRRQCPKIPKDVAKTMREQMITATNMRICGGGFSRRNSFLPGLDSTNSNDTRVGARFSRRNSFLPVLDSTNSNDIPCSSKSLQFCQHHTHDDIKMQAGNPSQASEQATKKLKMCNPFSNSTALQTQKSTYSESITEEPHDNISSENTNKTDENAGASSCWSRWKSVLEGLLQLPGLQEGVGIQSCIRDALVNDPIAIRMVNGITNDHKNTGKSQISSVDSSEAKMNSERTSDTKAAASNVEIHGSEDSNINTAKCQNVLTDILSSGNFALLCDILWRAVHQDEQRSRYFDFSIIDSKMKNGDYEQSPELFNQDMQLVWKDLQKIGQEIIDLASNLSGITQASYTKQVQVVEGSGDGEQRPKEAAVVSAQQKNLTELNTLIPSTSKDISQLAQLDRVDASDIQKVKACKQCATEAKVDSIIICHGCREVYHPSCVEPSMQIVPAGSWYCKHCSITCRELGQVAIVLDDDQESCLHELCVVCDKLQVCKPREGEQAVRDRALVVPARETEFLSVKPGESPELSRTAISRSCKVCGMCEEDDKRFLTCGHVHCPYKYYHIRCLKTGQIASMAQRGKPCWYCPSCLCRGCLSDKDDDKIILCDGCDEAYHLYCMTPPRTSVPKGRWYCASCNVERAKEGMRQYEQRILKLHGKKDVREDTRTYAAVDLLLCAAEKLEAAEQLAPHSRECGD